MIFNKLPADIVNKQNPFVSMARKTQDFSDITVNIVAVFSRLIIFLSRFLFSHTIQLTKNKNSSRTRNINLQKWIIKHQANL
ncbi:hypothetical protein F6X66_09375 [Dickeya solani]|nr:hypothetical protein [Dickeya solani]MZG61314.1 hypothetical protein [Dickeya solani]MZH09206.1 hypothetical protein [Dickeya solani]MZH47400.1 hypothetical protein [Dickeya solani]MZJ00139.1 hypothetical protein [Dickeya solani]